MKQKGNKVWHFQIHFATGGTNKKILTSLEITVTPLPFCCSCSLYVMSRFISELIDGVTWIYNRMTMHCVFQKIFHSQRGNRDFLFHPSFRCTSLVRLCPSLAHRLEPSGQQGATMCWEGEHLSCSDVDGRGGGAHCSPGAFVSDTVPLWGLMRTNWSECNKWIMELDKRLYFVGCVCWDPPIICPLSRARWLASAWSGSLNISLSLSCLFYYMSALCVRLPTVNLTKM